MITCSSGRAAFQRLQRLQAVHPGIATSSSTMSGGSPWRMAATISSPRRVRARLVPAQREKGTEISREARVVVDDRDVRGTSLVGGAVSGVGAGAGTADIVM